MPALWILPAALAVFAAGAVLAPAVVERMLLGGIVGSVLTGLAGIIGYVAYALAALALRIDATLTAVGATLMVVALTAAARHRVAPLPADDRPDGDDDGGGGLRRPDPERPRDPGPSGLVHPDWDAFDAARGGWEHEREREREPAVPA